MSSHGSLVSDLRRCWLSSTTP